MDSAVAHKMISQVSGCTTSSVPSSLSEEQSPAQPGCGGLDGALDGLLEDSERKMGGKNHYTWDKRRESPSTIAIIDDDASDIKLKMGRIDAEAGAMVQGHIRKQSEEELHGSFEFGSEPSMLRVE